MTSVAPFGLFVELEGLYIEGLVHISNLGGDYFEFDQRHHRLVGARSKRVFGLGEPLRVRVVRVSLDERKIDLEIVAGGEGGQRESRASRKESRQEARGKRRGR